MQVSRRSALAILAGWALLGLPRADAGIVGYNEDARFTAGGFANDFEIVVPGNRFFNDFRFGFPGGSVNTNFNSTTNQTTLTFSGGSVPSGTLVHFGYTLQDGTPNSHGKGPPDVLSKTFTFNGSPVQTVATGFTPSLSNIHGIAGAVRYLVLFAQALPVGGNPATDMVDDWVTVPLPFGQNGTVQFTNAGAQDLEIFNARYLFLTESDIGLPETDPNFGNTLLGMLDSTHLPMTDPRFTPVPGITDGMTIRPGGSTPDSFVPEPSSFVLLGLGAVGLALRARVIAGRRARS